MKIRFLFNFYHYLRTPFITTSVEASVGKLAVSSIFFFYMEWPSPNSPAIWQPQKEEPISLG